MVLPLAFQSMSLRASMMFLRATILSNGATASSKSKIKPSAFKHDAFSSARAFDPGVYNKLRQARVAIFNEIFCPLSRHNEISCLVYNEIFLRLFPVFVRIFMYFSAY